MGIKAAAVPAMIETGKNRALMGIIGRYMAPIDNADTDKASAATGPPSVK